MKFIIAMCTAFVLCTSLSFAQQRNLRSSYGVADTSWLKLGRPTAGVLLFYPNFSNDATTGSDTLWCVVGRDTTKKFPLFKGETIQISAQCDTLMWRASANTIPYRVWGVW